MTYIMVDVESDGPIPGDYSMISFGAVLVDTQLDKTFYRQLQPISDKFILEKTQPKTSNIYAKPNIRTTQLTMQKEMQKRCCG